MENKWFTCDGFRYIDNHIFLYRNVNLLISIGQFGVGTYLDWISIDYRKDKVTLKKDDTFFVYDLSFIVSENSIKEVRKNNEILYI